MPSPNDCSMCARIGFALLGIILGLATGVVFATAYHNVHVAVWSFLSAAIAAFTLYVHVTYLKDYYVKSTSQLKTFMFFGCLIELASVCCCVVYAALALYEHQGIVLHGRGYVLAAAWCLLTFAWSFQLFYFSRAYFRILQDGGEAKNLLSSDEKCEEKPKIYSDIVCCSIQCLE